MVISIVPTTLKFVQGWDKDSPGFYFLFLKGSQGSPNLSFASIDWNWDCPNFNFVEIDWYWD